MSSVASQRALLAALGGVSIAALFVWYYQSKKMAEKEEERKRIKRELSNGSNGKAAVEAVPASNSDENKQQQQQRVNVEEESPVEKSMPPSSEEEQVKEEKATIVFAPGPSGDGPASAEQNVSDASDVDSQHAVSSGERSVSEGDYEIEDTAIVCQKSELTLDVSQAMQEQEAFSWSEEMERSYLEEMETANNHDDNYIQSESPGARSQNSEVSSQDSGRATGGLASSLSPMDDISDGLPMYEFEIPNSLVGLIIGIKGKTIKELSTRTEVRMLIRPHHAPEKANTHQICQVRGKREHINRCLQMLRRRFPPARFPELNLQPVLPPALPTNLFDAFSAQPSWLSLPENIPCEVVCSAVIDPGHFFVQQPTHPSYPSLAHLDRYMLNLYGGGGAIPELPKPFQSGLLCAAPVLGAWFRAVTTSYYEEEDEVLVRFVDYGGYKRLPRADLRQIRTDLMSLPFQATEVFLAGVQPVDGTMQWCEEANPLFHELCEGKIITATVVGTHVDAKVPMVEISVDAEDKTKLFLHQVLLDKGYAKTADPSKMARVSVTYRPSLSTQSSQILS